MKSMCNSHGCSNSHGNSACNGGSMNNGASPASRTITGVTLGGREYGAYPELA